VLDTDTHVLHYADVQALMQALRRLGARNAARARARGLTSPRRLQAMVRAYEQSRTPRGLPATYEVLYGAVFAPKDQTRARPRTALGAAGEQLVPLSALGRPRP
jgi:malonyl-CoA O-methyltransferase